VFNRLAHGPAGVELWNEFIAHINNIALEERATLDTIDSGWDPVLSPLPGIRPHGLSAFAQAALLLPLRPGSAARMRLITHLQTVRTGATIFTLQVGCFSSLRCGDPC
jgi:hypothetical protein